MSLKISMGEPRAGVARWLRRRRRVPVLQQLSAVECGAACLAMILSYHGRETSVAECRDRCGAGRGGVTARAIARAASEYGLLYKAYRLDARSFNSLRLPVIAHWEFKHFVVVEKWAPDRVEIIDPAAGRRTLRAEEFAAGFAGVALSFEPGADFCARRGGRRARGPEYLRSIFMLPGAGSAILQILLASLALQVLGLAAPFFTGLIVDRLLPNRETGLMAALGAGILLVVAGQTALGFLRSSVLIHLRARLDSHLTHNFLDHLLTLPYDFFQKRTGGDLLMRLNSNSFIREVLTNNTLSLLLDGSFVLVYLLIMFGIDARLALLAAGLGGLQLSILLATGGRMKVLMQRELAAKSAEQGYLVEVVSGISALKASGAEGHALQRWSELYSEHMRVSVGRGHLSAKLDTMLGTLRTLSPLLLLWLGTMRVLDGSISLGTMLALKTLALSFLSPITALVTNGQQLLVVSAHLERIGDVLDAGPEQGPGGGRLEARLSGRIEVRNLGFQYDPNGPPVLRDVSFEIEPGQKVALVGPTGSGKSTLALLLLGLYQPTRGEVLYDGTPLHELNYRSLRSQMGVVMQEPFLFSGSVLQNITLGDPAARHERVREVAAAACIHDDIVQMPLGYETFVSERGASLSGGQRQRLALARALARGPRILLLDEATSHLDAQTEAEVEGNLNDLSCTRIVLAHRLSTVRNADKILVLGEGLLVEAGTHAELVEKGGYYANLVGRPGEVEGEGIGRAHV